MLVITLPLGENIIYLFRRRKKTKKLLLVFLILVFTNISYADPNLVGWWKLDSDADDYSGQGNNGTIYGNPQWVAGQIDDALDFDGDNDYVEIPHNDNLSLVSEGTVVAWINLNNAVRQGIVTKQPGTSSGNYFLMINSSDSTLFAITNGTWDQKVQTEDPTPCPTNQWVFYVGTFNTSFTVIP